MRVLQGDLFSSGCEALVNPVNCLGVHGKGLAREFASRWPAACAAYSKVARSGAIAPGDLDVQVLSKGSKILRIIFFPTKNHWRDPSKLEYITMGLVYLIDLVQDLSIKSIAIPALGCGLGGLSWETVRPHLEAAGQTMAATGCEVQLFSPVAT